MFYKLAIMYYTSTVPFQKSGSNKPHMAFGTKQSASLQKIDLYQKPFQMYILDNFKITNPIFLELCASRTICLLDIF